MQSIDTEISEHKDAHYSMNACRALLQRGVDHIRVYIFFFRLRASVLVRFERSPLIFHSKTLHRHGRVSLFKCSNTYFHRTMLTKLDTSFFLHVGCTFQVLIQPPTGNCPLRSLQFEIRPGEERVRVFD